VSAETTPLAPLQTVRIAVDCMGGDHGASVTLPACRSFLAKHPQAELLLVGSAEALAPAQGWARCTPVIATEVVTMDDPIEVALRKKRDSSMRVAINQLKSGAHACISAGNTGALMALSRFLLKTLDGIDRPAIATVAVFTMIPAWNDLWFPLILAPSDETKTVTLGVQQFIGQYVTNWNAVLAALSLAIAPILILYVVFSRHLVRGLTMGAVK